jgi:hypothetical protein
MSVLEPVKRGKREPTRVLAVLDEVAALRLWDALLIEPTLR